MVPRFRCWFKDTGTQAAHMVEWHELREFKALGDLLQYSEKNKTFHLMQSTGLKDKNGVEIFEGDVLKNTRNGKIRRVHWNPSCASFHLSKHGIEESKVEYWSLSNPQWSYEIIGNIYENPELLEHANEN